MLVPDEGLPVMKDGGHMDDLRLVSPPKPAKVDPDEVDNIGTLVLALGIPPPCKIPTNE